MKLLMILLLAATFCVAQDWQLVWSDEFDGTEIDPQNWSYEVNGTGGGNNELQYYTDRTDNSFVQDGKLVIIGKKERFTGPDGTRDYTSARMVTRDHASWKYGKFEIRAKLPYGQGIWPAFWMMPDSYQYGTWAACGEIDIMEMVGHTPNIVHGTLHYGGQWPDNVHTGNSFTLSDGIFHDDFHTFTLEWQPTEMRWYVDDKLYATQTEWYTTGASYPAPYDQNFYLILNLAIGGNWPGSPNASTIFPQQVEIDYIRVYQDASPQPTFELTEPQEGAMLDPYQDVELAVIFENVDELVSRVDFFCGDVKIGFDRSAPHSMIWKNVYPGCYQIKAVATLKSQRTLQTGFQTVQVGPECVQAPYTGTPIPIPGVVEAELYDLGGNGAAFSDQTDENEGNAYGNTFRRDEAVDCQDCTLGGYNIGWIVDYEWIEYHIKNDETQNFKIVTQIATPNSGGKFRILIDSNNVSGTLNTPQTGDWQNWQTVDSPEFTLEAGDHIMRFHAIQGNFNLNKFEFVSTGTRVALHQIADEFVLQQNYPNPFNPSTNIKFTLAETQLANLHIFDITGRSVQHLLDTVLPAGTHQIEFDGRGLASGIYFYQLSTEQFTASKKMLLVE